MSKPKATGHIDCAEKKAWANMIQRCDNPQHPSYKHYGGRGIKICARWYDFFEFILDMGKKPAPNLTLERKDNSKGYNKENCMWTTQRTQNRNKRNNKIIDCGGKPTVQIAAIEQASKNINSNTVRSRLGRGWNLDQAATTPVSAAKEPAALEYAGKLYSQKALASLVGMSRSTLRRRLAGGMTVEEAVTTPAK